MISLEPLSSFRLGSLQGPPTSFLIKREVATGPFDVQHSRFFLRHGRHVRAAANVLPGSYCNMGMQYRISSVLSMVAQLKFGNSKPDLSNTAISGKDPNHKRKGSGLGSKSCVFGLVCGSTIMIGFASIMLIREVWVETIVPLK